MPVKLPEIILDPSQDDPRKEKQRAAGLKKLYLQLVNPSVDYLEALADGLTGLPFSVFWSLRSDTLHAGEDPDHFFSYYGLGVSDSQRLREGISHASELLDHFSDRFDFRTGKLNPNYLFNPGALAESTHEMIQVRRGERRLAKGIELIKNEPDIKKRSRMGYFLKKNVLTFIDKSPFAFYIPDDEGKPQDYFNPTWERLSNPRWRTELKAKASLRTGYFGIREAVETANAAIVRYQLEKELQRLPSRDQDQFDQLRLQYGAKAANLMILSEVVRQINGLRKHDYSCLLAVPVFKVVPVDLYRAWREGRTIDNDLYPYFEWASALQERMRSKNNQQVSSDYIVRSSAVFSEDGEKATGAGIYESVRVSGGAAFQDFKDAVVKVYGSTDSLQARTYRAGYGINNEEMGLLIQKFITDRISYSPALYEKGYINSKLAGVPQLMEIVTEISRNFIRKKELDLFLGPIIGRNEQAFRKVHHFPPDLSRVRSEFLVDAAYLTSIVERIWGRDLQIEFVTDSLAINFVQVRELPANIPSRIPEVQFPDEQSIHVGASIGIGDRELTVLDKGDNSEEVGVVILPENFMFSTGDNSYLLPKEGAVIICEDRGKSGHIQTLCAERGLICVFPDVNNWHRETLRYHELVRLDKIRIVSNGIEGRIYKVRK